MACLASLWHRPCNSHFARGDREMCRVNDLTERPMTRSLAAAFGVLILITMGTAEAQPKSATLPELASVPTPNAFESLSPGNKRVATALFEAQSTTTGTVTPMP